jgi:class 3 adenylate cyclase
LQRENLRLAAIVAADIAGYSRLIGQDEEGTLRAHRADLIEPLIEQHSGRIANTAGDSLLLEFPSAVDAVRCSIAVQEGMAERNSGIEADRRISLRIGINVGDVVAQGDNLLGDGVNVAARLESLCETGGLCLSATPYDYVSGNVAADFVDTGEYKVKNIARPVKVFRVLQEDEVAATPVRRTATWQKYAAAVVIVVAVFAAGGGYGPFNDIPN